MIVAWSKTSVAQFSWIQVQLTLPVGVNAINVDAVSGIKVQAINYIAVDDVTIATGDCPQRGNLVIAIT